MKKIISLMIVFALVSSLLFGFGSISSVKAGGPTTEEIVQKVLEAKADYLKEKMNLPEVPDEIKQRREELQIPTELIDGVSIPKDVVEAKHITSGNDFIQIALDCPSEPLLKYAAEHGVSIDSDLARSKLDEMKSTHGVLKAKLLSIGVSLTDVHDMYVAYNGITATVKISDITNMYENFGRDHDVQRIYNNDFKKGNIHIERLYKLDLDYSVSLIGADTVWTDPGADGTGMTVGVIDTGVDYTHPDLGSGFGAGFKVSAGYDFGDNDNDPMDCQGHGTHVSGIMAADGVVKGVAPKANIVFGKIVSGCAGFASDIDIARAFDYMADPTNTDSGPEGTHDPVASVNLSFGADYGFVDPTAPDQQAIENCIASGITVALSAGNAYWSYYDFGYYPFFPDAASIGSPSVTPNCIAVGASWNEKSRYPALREYSTTSNYAYTVGSGSPDPVTALGTNSDLGYDYVYCGLGGSASDFPASVSGKIALIQRGTYTFELKINNAEEAGAIGAIIFNDAARGDSLLTMDTGGETLPSVFIGHSAGTALLVLAQAPGGDGTGRVGFPASNYVDTDAPVDTMVDFSSWGPPPDLSFKPDITAPGGGIWSTVPIAQGSYANYSGTSMSSPHIAACAALVKQVHPTWTPDQVKTVLMNTAELILDPSGLPYSPHLMGAGRVNVNYALHTDVTVTNNNDAKPYVALGEIPDYKTTPATFTVTLTNSGSAAVTYDISANAQNVAILMNSSDLGSIITTNPSGSVTVPATGTADVIVTINTTGIADWTGSPYYGWPYLEGFVVFTPSTGTELHIPYMGFLGKWNQFEDEYAWDFNPVMDPAADDPMNFMSTYVFGSPVTWPWVTGGPYGYFYAGIDFYGNLDRNAIAFNPNAAYLEADIALLRNAQNLNISIKNSSGGSVVKTIDSVDQLPKNPVDWYGWYWYYDNPNTGMPWWWDGTDEGGLSVSDGKYYLTLTATAPKIFNKASYDAPHVIDFPVSVDRVPPKTAVTATTNSDGSCTLSWIVSDATPSSGIWGYALVINDDLGSIIMLPPTTTSYTVSSLPEGEHPFRLMAIDNANNVGLGSAPTISVVPEFVTVTAGGVTSATIYTSDPDGDTLTLSVIVAPIPEGAYELKNSVLYFHPKAGDVGKRFVFTIVAADSAGYSDTGTFTVQVDKPQDTTPPELDIPNVDFDTSQVISHGTMLLNLIATDDSGVIARTVVKDNGIVIKDVMGYLSNLNITLFEGINDIEVMVYDLAGNFTAKSFRVISDTKPPVIKLSDMPESVSSNELNITGIIFDTGTGIKEVKINGKTIAVPSSGKINVTCTLTQGKNIITVQATDKAGNAITKTYTVNYTAYSPMKIITLQISNPEITINGITKTIDEQESKPVIKNDRTLLPVRVLIESLGGTISWNGVIREVTINLNGHTIILTIDNNTAIVDGIKMLIDPNNDKVTPIIINGRTYLPLRFIIEHLNGTVSWDSATQTVTIYYMP